MKVKLTTDKITPEQFISRAFYLLYLACGREVGMGLFQARTGVTEKDVYKNVICKQDYCFSPGVAQENMEKSLADGDFYGDYVFGRMMKWGCKLNDGIITLRDAPYRPDYQGFAFKYDSPEAIINAVMESFGINGGTEIVS